MSNAKRCDICGKYFDIPEVEHGRLEEDYRHLNLIRMHQALPEGQMCYHDDPWLQFDLCDDCYDKLLDYIIGGKAEASVTS